MYFYGFVHVSSTERLQGDSEGSPCWIQVVLHHLQQNTERYQARSDRNLYQDKSMCALKTVVYGKQVLHARVFSWKMVLVSALSYSDPTGDLLEILET